MMHNNAKIYVAGHKGLVGSAIFRNLVDEGYANLAVRSHEDLDLRKPGEVDAFFKSERPEYVFLCAAKVGGILANSTFPAAFIYDNLMIQTNVIHAACQYSVKKLLFLGSSCIYPRDCPQPMKEEYLLSGILEQTNEAYAIAKIAGIKMCQAYNRQYGTSFVCAMPTNLYGPGDNFDLENSHVLPALIRKFHEGKSRDESRRTSHGMSKPVTIWGTGNPRREFLHVDDLADALCFLMHHYERNEIINIGVGKDISIRELGNLIRKIVGYEGTPFWDFLHVDDLADALCFLMHHYERNEIINIGVGRDISIRDLGNLIRKIVGYEGDVQFDPSKPDGTPRKLLDVNRLNGLGWQSKIPLEEGIAGTYQWYLEGDPSKTRVFHNNKDS